MEESMKPTNEEHMACQLASWYPAFSKPFPDRRKGLTFHSRILDVPASFLPYMIEDGVRLPPNAKTSSCLECKPQTGEDDDDGDNWSSDSSSVEQMAPPPLNQDLNQLTERITSAINDLGGSVVPKLNWSAPKDATWMNEGTIKCSTAGDVYLLLKSSDFVSSDLELLGTLNEEANNIHLILRKWANLFPSQEFRCFVKDHRLIGASQRHTDQHFGHLAQEKDELLLVFEEFLQDFVLHKFATGTIANYVVDVYIDRQDRVWIVDFNVWGERTDSLLFDWDELRVWEGEKEREIRIVETEKEVRPHPLNNFRAPVDTVHIASITGGSADSFKAFMDLCKNQDNEE